MRVFTFLIRHAHHELLSYHIAMKRCKRSSSLSINQPNDERCHTFNVTSAVITASKDIDFGKLKNALMPNGFNKYEYRCGSSFSSRG